MPPRAGAGLGRGAATLAAPPASRLLFLPLLLAAVAAALTPGAAGYADTPQVDAASLPPNSFVNVSNPAQLAAYAQSQGLPPDANATRPCGCDCLPTWSHMILPDYNNRLVALNNYTALIMKEHACAVDDWAVPWCYVNTTTCPDAVPCVNAIAPWAPCAAAGDKQTLPDISNFDCSIGGVTTSNAVPVDAVTEDAYAEHPLGCECKSNWTFAGETLHGCANPGNNWPSAWCYVDTATCLPGAWACAIEQGLWGQCDSIESSRTSNTSSLHMCQTQGPGLHGIERIEPASSSTTRNPAIVIGAVCGLLGGLLLLAAGLLAVMARRRSTAGKKLADDDEAEKAMASQGKQVRAGDVDKALQLSRGWSASTAGSSSAPADGAACVARSSDLQSAAAGSSWPAADPPASLDAISAAAVLSVGRPVSTWPLARVSEHDCAALVADLVRHSQDGEQGSDDASQRQQTVELTAPESHQQLAPVAGQQLTGGCTGSSAAGPATIASGSRRHGSMYPVIDAVTEAVESRWLPHTERHGLWLKAAGADPAAAQPVAEDPDAQPRCPAVGGCQPSAAQGLSASPEPGQRVHALTEALCLSEVPPSDPGAWPANTHSSYGMAVAVDAPLPPAPTHSGFGVCAASSEQPPESPPPLMEFPGNPFAVARDQQNDNVDTFSAAPSVRRRTPTPLLSTLRPDYKAGREHPLLRW